MVFIFGTIGLGGLLSAVHGEKAAKADIPTVALGNSFDVGGLAVSGMKATTKSDLGSDGIMDTTAKGIYLLITADVTNNDNKAHGLDSTFQKLHIGDKEYSANPFAGIGSVSDIKTSVNLEPGFSDTVTFVFDVPLSTLNGAGDGFTEKTVLNVSTGPDFDAPEPREVTVVINKFASYIPSSPLTH